MKVRMEPHLIHLDQEGGLSTLIRKYFDYLPKVGIELVSPKDDNFDLIAQHASGMYNYVGNVPICAHLHGAYWTGDNNSPKWEFEANAHVIHSVRMAKQVTVPSEWVAETFRRDMHINPTVLPHGIDWDEWQHNESNDGYILWNKNRNFDICNPYAVGELAKQFPDLPFVTTFAPRYPLSNVKEIGVQPHAIMKRIVQHAGVYLSSIKETFGIGTLEAMASGIPILGFSNGGNRQLVKHGVNGYLACVGDYADLANGLRYCLRHRQVLGANGREMARSYTWISVAEQIAEIYKLALTEPKYVISVVIPCYNYADKLERAVKSVLSQVITPDEIIIVDNNSTDNTKEVVHKLINSDQYTRKIIQYLNCTEQGVAYARNMGIYHAQSKYICCLDADDEIDKDFLRICVSKIREDSTLGVVYTKLRWINDADGTTGISDWPGQYNFDRFLGQQNQVPTCSVFRRDLWERLGGYRQRYAPRGQGAEDAEFYFRMGEIGYKGALATEAPLFLYHLGGRTQQEDYAEPDWLSWHRSNRTPFASVATPAQFSHPVYQYDEPKISVIIPVGPGHEKFLIDALDSLEAQSFSDWEVIVVFDTEHSNYKSLLKAYPFISRSIHTKQLGAGAARNAGAKIARSPLLLFLDADDWLDPKALEQFYDYHALHGGVVYSDYIGHSYIKDPKEIQRLATADRLLDYDEKTTRAVITYESAEYDCETAIRQPEMRNGQYYIWNLVSSLVPKEWHDAIGGFDESMKSWEDWDYWLRLARKDYCFTHLKEHLVHYRFYTGNRREAGGQLHESLIEYLKQKYEGEKPVCNNCRGNSNRTMPTLPSSQQAPQTGDMRIRLNDGNKGDHSIVGFATRKFYGYYNHGDEFDMDSRDISARPGAYVVLGSSTMLSAKIEVQPISELPEPVALIKPLPKGNDIIEEKIEPEPVADFDFTQIKGFDQKKIEALNEMGIHTLDGFLNIPSIILKELFPGTPQQLNKLIKAAKALA